jgi:Na+/proline symporter
MRWLDWAVLICSVVFIVGYGLWRSRGSDSVNRYLLAGKTMPWYAMALSIMATQASAITFISTTGQAYVDGMRFVQIYLGLPMAMILICATAVPLFHRSGVYTAYEYLERRFDAKTRALVSIVFLIQRGLAVGIALSAPAIVLKVILGWPDQWTTLFMGIVVVAYTTVGGIQAVTWTDFQQMLIMFTGLLIALGTAIWLLPADIGLTGALHLAGAAGRLNPVVTSFDWNDRYNIWNGLIGGLFLSLAYFGTDQSQVQRYLTGRSIAQSRLSLLFNAVAKVPMQFLILATGAVVFVFYTFTAPPVLFDQAALKRVQQTEAFPELQARYDSAFSTRATAARAYAASQDSTSLATYRDSQKQFEAVKKEGSQLAEKVTGGSFNDTNYIFLTFVMAFLPAGVVGLIMAAIFAAAMSTISAEVNSLATVTVIDVYQRHIRREATDAHYLKVSKLATLFWGAYAVVTALFTRGLGSLIEAVNMVGSLFYGGMLGVFVLAFFTKRVNGTAAFTAVLAGEAGIFWAAKYTDISFLWYNVIGCVVVVLVGLALSFTSAGRTKAA